MKVAKKDERLARAMLAHQLWANGFPKDRIYDRVSEAWPGLLEHAKGLNSVVNQIKDYELDGCTTQEEIDRWSG